MFADRSALRAQIRQKALHLKRYVTPLLSKSADSVTRLGVILSPIASSKYVCNCIKVQQRKDLVHPNDVVLSSDLQLICHFVGDNVRKSTPKRGSSTLLTTPLPKKPQATVVSPQEAQPKSGDEVAIPPC